jgi:hypothetical protein
VTTVNEAILNNKPPLAAELAAGVQQLSGNQQITFTLYKRMVLPLDGFVFWVNYNLVTPTDGDPAATKIIQGSLHFSTETEQEEDSTISMNTIVFTALELVDRFNQIDPQFMYLASYRGIRFCFNSQGKYYQQADLWHYVGVAVTSVMRPQIIDTLLQLNSLKLIVTNSLPIWLGMPAYVPPYPGFTCPIAKIYPSYLIPANEIPPYAGIHIEETKALESIAFLNRTLGSSQLTSEIVRVTTYGVDNDDIVTFLNFVIQYSGDWGILGIMNMPIIIDEKHVQSEITAIAQKKIIEFKVSYLQQSVRDVARQFILGAIVQNQWPGAPGPIKVKAGAKL